LNLLSRKDEIFLQIAATLGSLSTCDRAFIGAVVTQEGRAICWGYNGAPPGLPHCDENYHGWARAFRVFARETGKKSWTKLEEEMWCQAFVADHGCRNSTHAEANALAAAAKQGISTDGGTLYVSQSPCLTCSRLIVAAGIVRVVYDTMYRDHSGIELLKTAGVEIDDRDQNRSR
jgi:dCMP deaminase